MTVRLRPQSGPPGGPKSRPRRSGLGPPGSPLFGPPGGPFSGPRFSSVGVRKAGLGAPGGLDFGPPGGPISGPRFPSMWVWKACVWGASQPRFGIARGGRFQDRISYSCCVGKRRFGPHVGPDFGPTGGPTSGSYFRSRGNGNLNFGPRSGVDFRPQRIPMWRSWSSCSIGLLGAAKGVCLRT